MEDIKHLELKHLESKSSPVSTNASSSSSSSSSTPIVQSICSDFDTWFNHPNGETVQRLMGYAYQPATLLACPEISSVSFKNKNFPLLNWCWNLVSDFIVYRWDDLPQTIREGCVNEAFHLFRQWIQQPSGAPKWISFKWLWVYVVGALSIKANELSRTDPFEVHRSLNPTGRTLSVETLYQVTRSISFIHDIWNQSVHYRPMPKRVSLLWNQYWSNHGAAWIQYSVQVVQWFLQSLASIESASGSGGGGGGGGGGILTWTGRIHDGLSRVFRFWIDLLDDRDAMVEREDGDEKEHEYLSLNGPSMNVDWIQYSLFDPIMGSVGIRLKELVWKKNPLYTISYMEWIARLIRVTSWYRSSCTDDHYLEWTCPLIQFMFEFYIESKASSKSLLPSWSDEWWNAWFEWNQAVIQHPTLVGVLHRIRPLVYRFWIEVLWYSTKYPSGGIVEDKPSSSTSNRKQDAWTLWNRLSTLHWIPWQRGRLGWGWRQDDRIPDQTWSSLEDIAQTDFVYSELWREEGWVSWNESTWKALPIQEKITWLGSFRAKAPSEQTAALQIANYALQAAKQNRITKDEFHSLIDEWFRLMDLSLAQTLPIKTVSDLVTLLIIKTSHTSPASTWRIIQHCPYFCKDDILHWCKQWLQLCLKDPKRYPPEWIWTRLKRIRNKDTQFQWLHHLWTTYPHMFLPSALRILGWKTCIKWLKSPPILRLLVSYMGFPSLTNATPSSSSSSSSSSPAPRVQLRHAGWELILKGIKDPTYSVKSIPSGWLDSAFLTMQDVPKTKEMESKWFAYWKTIRGVLSAQGKEREWWNAWWTVSQPYRQRVEDLETHVSTLIKWWDWWTETPSIYSTWTYDSFWKPYTVWIVKHILESPQPHAIRWIIHMYTSLHTSPSAHAFPDLALFVRRLSLDMLAIWMTCLLQWYTTSTFSCQLMSQWLVCLLQSIYRIVSNVNQSQPVAQILLGAVLQYIQHPQTMLFHEPLHSVWRRIEPTLKGASILHFWRHGLETCTTKDTWAEWIVQWIQTSLI